MINHFDLQRCMAGETCYTYSGRRAKFLFRMNSLVPLVFMVEEFTVEEDEWDDEWALENYTIDGKHLYDPGMDLYMDMNVEKNDLSPSAPHYLEKLDLIYENKMIAEAIEKSKHNNYYLF
jgi:hypothetical protein